MELASGSVECGRRWQQFDTCVAYGFEACDATAAIKTACGADLLDYVDACFPSGQLTIAAPIRKQCIAN